MNNNSNNYDVIVVGAGHAGIEAAASAARMKMNVLLVTLEKANIGHMPCNPAVGGIGKGHIVFEISALGGIMPQLCSRAYLQANQLNMSKGPAVHGLRLQIDKDEYKKQAIKIMEQYEGITIVYDKVEELLIANQFFQGIKTVTGTIYTAKTIVITSGTFLNGLLHMGLTQQEGGRYNEKNVRNLSDQLKKNGIELGRLKTGTPARLDEKSINFSILEEQRSHDLTSLFLYDNEAVVHKKSCFITYTNQNTHQIILDHAHLSPIYKGDIVGIAPRYCPSIEDKIKRFASKNSHHVFVEPEGMMSNEWYPNGLSTSLPIDVQTKFLRTIVGFENVELTKPGYAIEYDFVYPNQLKHSLESKAIQNVFFAGQINGTTGYEEAAGQGIIAGINAALKVKGQEPFILSRQESYIGVMIDDLITLGVDEPYRMFTSRAERRLLLRQDNVFYRLGHYAYKYGLIQETLYHRISTEYEHASALCAKFQDRYPLIGKLFTEGKADEVKNMIKAEWSTISDRVLDYICAELLYHPYYERELFEIKKMNQYQSLIIPAHFMYENVPGLSIELQQKLNKFRPSSIAQATLIQGMTPAAISLLIFKIRECENCNQ
jgi:tRNA uridine 5-carboxymethylaminomethyl modification enzyme